MKTIRFNTGRMYTAHNQRITATLHDDGVITFMDHDRGIPGELKVRPHPTISPERVMNAYDHGEWLGSQRSDHDGMYKGGVNLLVDLPFEQRRM